MKRLSFSEDARRNPLFRQRIVRARKGKGSYTRKGRKS